MLKKRIVNFRVMFFAFVGLMIGIIFSRLFLYNFISLTLSICMIILALFVCVIGIIYAIKTHKNNQKTEFRKDVSPMMSLSLISLILMFIIGVGISLSPLIKIATAPKYTTTVRVVGVVSDYVADNTTYKKFILDECSIVNNDTLIDLDFKICIYTNQFAEVQLGDNIDFEGKLDNFNYSNGQDFSKLIQNIGYSAYVSYENLSISEGNKELKDIVKNNVFDMLHKNLNYDNANISYGILFGEKQGINQEITNMFSYAGISHILAVSGLHVGVLVGIIHFLLSKIKKGKYLKLALLSIILLFYSYLCSFTPSVCRASIMAVISMLASILGEEYDILSSLSIAGIIILLFSPMSLFSLSFQLSFLCVFSIIAFAPTIKMLFKKIKFPEFLASGFAISIATNLVLLPLCANIFTKVSMLGVIVNIFVLPFFSIVYVLLFLLVIFGLIIKPLGHMLILPNMFLHLIKVVANWASSASFGVFKLFNMGYLILFLVISFCLILHFLMIRFRFKSVILSIIFVIVLSLFLNYNSVNVYNGEHIVINYQSNTNTLFYVMDNNCTLIGSNISKYNIDKFMKENKIRKIDNIIAFDLTLNNSQELKSISDEYGVEAIYVSDKYQSNEISNYFGNVQYYAKNIELNNLKLYSIEYLNKSIGVYFESESLGNFVLPLVELNQSEGRYLIGEYGNTDYWVISDNFYNIDLEEIDCKKIYCHNYCDTMQDVVFIKDKAFMDLQGLRGE